MSYFERSIIEAGDSPSIDAFGRFRVSNTGNRFDVEFIYDKHPIAVDEVTSGGATASHNALTGDVVMAINNATAGTDAAMYSHYDVPYTAGSSQVIDITGTLDNAAIGGGTAAIFLRTSISGTVTETVVNQSSWDNNPGDIDWTKSQIFQMDFQSLKVGRIRFILVRSGVPVELHEIPNDNIRASGYWQRPTLPVYWRIYNEGGNTISEVGYGDKENGIGFRYTITANASASMRAICATVKSEGGDQLFNLLVGGLTFDAGNYTGAKTVSTTLIPICSIRMAALFNSINNRGLAIPIRVDIETDNPVRYAIYYRPTLTGASFTSVDSSYSIMEYDESATAISGGIRVAGGLISTGKNVGISGTSPLGRTIMSLGRTGTSDILTIAAIRTGVSNASVTASLSWKELR